MTDTVEVVHAGTSIFIDFPLEGQTIPISMTCEAKLINKDGTVALTKGAVYNTEGTAFELRVPYTDTSGFAGTSHTLLVRVTDSVSGYSDIIYEKKISWK